MIRTDTVIIGAGLLGCFTARHLSRYIMDVTVLEKEPDVCRGISKANTGIIYAGYDHKPGSLKSRLCIQANRDLDDLCSELEVPYSRTGSMMIAYGPRADKVIRRKYEDGLESGLTDIRIITGEEAQALEPSLKAGVTSALFSGSAATLDPWELGIAAYENAKSNGVRFSLGSEVKSIRREGGRFIVTAEGKAGPEVYDAGAVVNAAGLSSDLIREMTEEPLVRLFPTAADYIVLDRGSAGGVSHIIFHEGEDGKGLTLVPTADGSILIGPTEREAGEDELAASDMRVSLDGLARLRELCGEIVPGLDLSAQIRTFGSLRPNPFAVMTIGAYGTDGATTADGALGIVRDKKSIKDISITEDNGLFSLIGIKTPGLTIAGGLGMMTAEKVISYLGGRPVDPDFDPHRKAIVRARDLTIEGRAALADEDPDYGVIVCSCMDVTLAEIKQAIERGAPSFEAVRRRTGAGMGRCQGSRCRNRIERVLEDTANNGDQNTC